MPRIDIEFDGQKVASVSVQGTEWNKAEGSWKLSTPPK